MKKLLYTLLCLFFLHTAHGQEGYEKIRERMTEFIQKRLDLTKSEADRFGPVYLDYLNDLRKTNQEYKDDRLVLQQKIADLRLRYRDQFKAIIGEKKANEVFTLERDFINEVQRLRDERRQNRR